MKKLTLIFTVCFLALNLSAQLPNGNFELTDSTGKFPVHWEVSSEIGASLTEDSRSGKYAMKIWTWYTYVHTQLYNVDESQTDEFGLKTKGTAIQHIPKKLKGFYKLTECDTAYAEVKIFGAESDKEPVAVGSAKLTATDNYKPFTILLEKTGYNAPPARISVLFSSYELCDQVDDCCYLYIDKLKLKKKIRP